jgi:hypothetical protein
MKLNVSLGAGLSTPAADLAMIGPGGVIGLIRNDEAKYEFAPPVGHVC